MFQDKLTREIAAAAAQIKTEPPKNEVNTKSVEGAVVSIMANEELKGNQHKIDHNKNNKIDAHDFKLMRSKKKAVEVKEEESTDTPGNGYAHQCAIHVKHSKLGEGKTIYSQHAEPDAEGNIAWYDVMFSEGIQKQVPITELEVLVSESHGNHKRK